MSEAISSQTKAVWAQALIAGLIVLCGVFIAFGQTQTSIEGLKERLIRDEDMQAERFDRLEAMVDRRFDKLDSEVDDLSGRVSALEARYAGQDR